jgi:hypothetical protein
MSPDELLAAHRDLWFEAFSVKYSLKRVFRAMFRLRLGAFLMCAMMNLLYCLKALRGNAPACFDGRRQYEEFRDLPVERRRADLQVRFTRRTAGASEPRKLAELAER